MSSAIMTGREVLEYTSDVLSFLNNLCELVESGILQRYVLLLFKVLWGYIITSIKKAPCFKNRGLFFSVSGLITQ
jgi:hypothetical protein